jgi:hypothetical protein
MNAKHPFAPCRRVGEAREQGFDKLSPNGLYMRQPFALSRGLSLSEPVLSSVEGAPCRRVGEVREQGFDKLSPNGSYLRGRPREG